MNECQGCSSQQGFLYQAILHPSPRGDRLHGGNGGVRAETLGQQNPLLQLHLHFCTCSHMHRQSWGGGVHIALPCSCSRLPRACRRRQPQPVLQRGPLLHHPGRNGPAASAEHPAAAHQLAGRNDAGKAVRLLPLLLHARKAFRRRNESGEGRFASLIPPA